MRKCPFSSFSLDNIPDDVVSMVNKVVMEQFDREYAALTRRQIFTRGAGAVVALTLPVACKARKDGSAVLNTPGATVAATARQSFIAEMKQVMGPLLAALAAAPQPQPGQQPDPAFLAAAQRLGGAVAGKMLQWLVDRPADGRGPLLMFDELLALDPAQDQAVAAQGYVGANGQPDPLQKFFQPIFLPPFGPVIVYRHQDVIKAIETTQHFTVNPYSGQMKIATDGHYTPGEYQHFMLGTDNDTLYAPDALLLRSTLLPTDRAMLEPMIREACEAHTTAAQPTGQMDIIATIGSQVPVTIVDKYLGVHSYAQGAAAMAGSRQVKSGTNDLEGGSQFIITPEMTEKFQYNLLELEHPNQPYNAQTNRRLGRIPTPEQMYVWIVDAFRNLFNNFNEGPPRVQGQPLHPQNVAFDGFRARGALATEKISAWVHKLMLHYQDMMEDGEAVPDTMLTRLLKMQADAEEGGADAVALAQKVGLPADLVELKKRLTDGRIRANVFGTIVGAVANPAEATGRIIDAMLKLKAGEIQATNGSNYQRAVDAAQGGTAQDMDLLRRFALECLRHNPQGEMLLRECITTNTEIAGKPIRAGTKVFNGYASAVRDPRKVTNPATFDVNRDPDAVAYAPRPDEEPQSRIYLQHGYGRHKCPGRYASEMTFQETLRAILKLGDISRAAGAAGQLQMDAEANYAVSMTIQFSPYQGV